MLDKSGNNYQAINYHDLLNDLQKNHETDSKFLIRGIYHVFWFLTSNGHVYLPPDKDKIKTFSALKYQFKYFDYKKSEYIFEIARHIYNSSFPEA